MYLKKERGNIDAMRLEIQVPYVSYTYNIYIGNW